MVLLSRLEPLVTGALRGAVVAVVGAAAVAISLPRAASADQKSSVQAQISALEAQLAASGRQVHDLTFGYTAAEADVATLSQQVAVEQGQADREAALLQQSGAALRQALVEAYTGGFSQPSGPGGGYVASTSGGEVADPAVRMGYISIATSGVRDSLDSYRTARLRLASTLGALTSERRSAQAAAAAANRARQDALSQAARAGARLLGLEAQLAALEQEASLAAAQTSSRPGAVAASGSSRASVHPQGGPVNGGLVAFVRSEVGPPAAAPPAAPIGGPAPTTAAPTSPVPTVPPTSDPPTTVPPTTTTPPSAGPASQPPSGAGAAGGVWLQLRQCESGDDYQANTGNGFYGAYQFSPQTWTDLGYPGRPDLEPPAMQDQAAMKLQAQSGWGQWPACSAALGLA